MEPYIETNSYGVGKVSVTDINLYGFAVTWLDRNDKGLIFLHQFYV